MFVNVILLIQRFQTFELATTSFISLKLQTLRIKLLKFFLLFNSNACFFIDSLKHNSISNTGNLFVDDTLIILKVASILNG